MNPELYSKSNGNSFGTEIPLFALLNKSMHIKNYGLVNVSPYSGLTISQICAQISEFSCVDLIIFCIS
jgi:hypothetical protein